MSAIRLRLGKPEAGWLPVKFRHEAFALEFVASDVPDDPIQRLISSITLLAKGISNPQAITWHLEPFCYYFQFKDDGELILLEIMSSSNIATPRKIEYSLKGSFGEIILPIYRSIKGFATAEYTEPDWPSTEVERFEQLARIVKNRTRL